MNIRDKILAADDITAELVEVPQWGVTIEVRCPSVKVRSKMIADASNDDGDTDYERLYPALVVACAFDPETGEQIFTEADRPLLVDKSAAAIEKVAKAALRVSGLAPDSEEVLGKD